MEYLMQRLKEPSTWRGLAALLTAFGVVLSPEQTEAVLAAGLAVMGILGAFMPDRFGRKA